MNETDFAGRLSSLMFLGVFRWTRLQSYQRCVVVVLVISYLFVRLFCRHAGIDDKLKAWLYLLFSFSYKWKEIKIETLRFVKRIIWITVRLELSTTWSCRIDTNLMWIGNGKCHLILIFFLSFPIHVCQKCGRSIFSVPSGIPFL